MSGLEIVSDQMLKSWLVVGKGVVSFCLDKKCWTVVWLLGRELDLGFVGMSPAFLRTLLMIGWRSLEWKPALE